MATRKPLVLVAGRPEELAAGDRLYKVRELLTAPRTYYVRTDGNDSNNGMSNTSGGAFLTIQKAIDTVAALDNGGYDVTIQVAAGTYTAANVLKTVVGSGIVNITGAGDTTVIAPSVAGTCFGDTPTSGGWLGVYDITSMKLAPTVTLCRGIGATFGGGGIVYFGGINFAFAAAGYKHLVARRGALVGTLGRSYTITNGGASLESHAEAFDGGQIGIQNSTITLSGTPAFTSAFAYAGRSGIIVAQGNTFSGSAIGKRYFAETAGGITTYGGATYLPGNSAGTVTSPGWYV